jgi:hypothetical protein
MVAAGGTSDWQGQTSNNNEVYGEKRRRHIRQSDEVRIKLQKTTISYILDIMLQTSPALKQAGSKGKRSDGQSGGTQVYGM